MTNHLDMSMMLTIHDAFRRELDRIARFTARQQDDPGQVLRTALGWRLFKQFLRVHHTAEDDAVWGPMDQLLAGTQDRALLGSMEAEHQVIDPLLQAVDDALDDPDHGHERLGGAVEALRLNLRYHLRHEEVDGLALVDATLSRQQWARFGSLHLQMVGDDLGTYFPWLLDGAAADWVERTLNGLPPMGRERYEGSWKAAYEALAIWPRSPAR